MTAVALVSGKRAASTEARIVTVGLRRGMGIFLVLISALMLFTFGLAVSPHDETTFQLTSMYSTAWYLAPLHFPVRETSIVMAAVSAALGIWLVIRRQTRGSYFIFSVGIVLFLWSFLASAARDNSLNLVGMIGVTLISAVPIIFGSMSGVMCERSGVINVAIEGQFLMGAFIAAMIASASGNLWLGLVCGALAGGLLGGLLAFLSLRYAADQIIVGIVINAFALGLTNYLTDTLLVPYQNTLNSGPIFSPIAIPVLDKIPIIGPDIFDQNLFVYIAAILLVALTTGLFRTRWGLRVRAVGEHPEAAETVGIRVLSVRYRNVIWGGVIAGIVGIVSPLGLDAKEHFDRLVKGDSAIQALDDPVYKNFPPLAQARVRDFDRRRWVPDRMLRALSAGSAYALGSATEALQDSGVAAAEFSDCGLYVGSVCLEVSPETFIPALKESVNKQNQVDISCFARHGMKLPGELAAELQTPLVVADVDERQILIHPCRSHARPPPALASRLTAPGPEA